MISDNGFDVRTFSLKEKGGVYKWMYDDGGPYNDMEFSSKEKALEWSYKRWGNTIPSHIIEEK